MKNTLIVADKTEKGLLWFKFKENRTVFLLSPMGRLQVKWNDIAEKKTLFKLLRNLLVAKESENLWIHPLKQQTWIEYPVPSSFKLYWCDKASEYVLKLGTENVSDSSARDKLHNVEPFKAQVLNIKRAVEELRRKLRFLREPTFNEVALKSDCMDSETLRIGLTLASWKPEREEEALAVAEEAINLAGWLRLKKCGDVDHEAIALSRRAINNASVSAIRKAKLIIKNYPELVPRVGGSALRWPEETMFQWLQIFGRDRPPFVFWGKEDVLSKEANIS